MDFNERGLGWMVRCAMGWIDHLMFLKGEYQEESNSVGLRLVWSLSLEGCRAGKGRSLARKKLMVCLQETKI